jgi:hypothetical protein
MLRKVIKNESNLNDAFEDLNIIRDYIARWYEDKASLYDSILDDLKRVLINLHKVNGLIWFNIKPNGEGEKK